MTRSSLRRTVVLGLLGCVSVFLMPFSGSAAQSSRAARKSAVTAKAAATPKASSKAGSKTAARASRTQRKPTLPPSRPDRSLYRTAQKLENTLRASRRMMARRGEWAKVAAAYRNVVHSYPRSPYCDDALLHAGDIQRDMAKRFKSSSDADDALKSYALIVSEYPSSSLGEQALFATHMILTERKDGPAARAAAREYLDAYPAGSHAAAMKRAASSSAAGTAASNADVPIFGVRFWSGESSTRVVVDLARQVEIKQARLQSPPRLFIDLIGTRLHPNLVSKTFPVGNAFLKQIRIGVNRPNVVRVVIDFAEALGHDVFFLANPDRLVIDVRGDPSKSASLAPPADPGPSPANPAMEDVQITQELPILPEAESTPDGEVSDAPQKPVPASTPAPDMTDRGIRLAEAAPAPPSPAPPVLRPASSPVPEPTGAPSKNHDGSYSLARQLGLGARRICLDAGHGGHDPGAIGRGGTQEKDVTLAIVRKLEKLIRTELGADVVMTRDSDIYIPLEERTAIANASGADLFLSVHINSARNRGGRGLETYYLSFAKSAAAEELAARENAISQATMKDLNNLVKAIATNSKIDESRDFAGIIQRGHIETLSPAFPGVLDRGVHTAPFYVLIGANMPSILTEVGFVSNPIEERWLKSDKYQDKLAQSLLGGVRSYLAQLNRGQATKLGSRPGVRVNAKGRKKR